MGDSLISRRQAIKYTGMMTTVFINKAKAEEEKNSIYDVIVVGGSVAGLSAALTLGRSLRKVLVIDGGKPCNRQTPHAHNLFTRDGETPAQLIAIARQQLATYSSVRLVNGLITGIVNNEQHFALTTDDHTHYQARKIVLATGVEDIMPAIEGFAACWGRSVAHCPYCHGYELRDQPLGALGNGDAGLELAELIHHWSPKLTLFTNGPATLTDQQRQRLVQLNIPVIQTPLVTINHHNGFLHSLLLEDGTHVSLAGLFARVPFRQHSDLAQQLGVDLTSAGLISISAFGQTNVKGVYAAGDTSSLLRSLAMASASGSTAGAFLNRELIGEDFALH